MSNVNFSKSAQIFDSTIQFLQQCHLTKNHAAIKKVHGYLVTTGMLFVSHDFDSELIATYTKCFPRSKLQTLTNLFKCINSATPLYFNAIISDFCQKGLPFLALRTLSFMHTNGVPFDSYTLCSSLTASSKTKDITFGKQIHAVGGKSGWLSSVFVGSALIDLYAKFSHVKDAVLMFDEIPHKNTVCLNALLAGYGEAGLWVQELELIRKMPMLELKCDHFTLSAALRACTGLSAIEMGRQVHSYLLRAVHNVESDVFLLSALVEMYGKCGLVKKAWQVFKLTGMQIRGEKSKDIVLWTSMLGVYSRNGYYKEVFALYNEMLAKGIRIDRIAFLIVLSACSRTGQLQDGIKYFESMSNDFEIDPGPEHYSCLVDLLCRAGELQKAWELLSEKHDKRMGKSSISMWGALLSACVDQGNIELGKLAAERALELDPQTVGVCVMLSNLYARFGMWDEIGKLRRVLIRERGLKKDVGYSWVLVTC
ncbi:putative pentatricopeptide repeat-containing protein At3g23330 [Prosopis cineraria]|uniref:putative pentatricopeptide repeat-containing protein At3g23330 n=1 Tax=Prosopis cineraria TaxID=364024 RepID=UPI00240F8410|nr:putative pentatricopeptide repeat-containing protein At3g23330 [Prosopis cineraria]